MCLHKFSSTCKKIIFEIVTDLLVAVHMHFWSEDETSYSVYYNDNDLYIPVNKM